MEVRRFLCIPLLILISSLFFFCLFKKLFKNIPAQAFLIPPGFKGLVLFYQLVLLGLHIDMQYLGQLNDIIDGSDRQHQVDASDCRKPVHLIKQPADPKMQEADNSHCIKSLGYGTFQADNTFIIKRLLVVIPPQLSQKMYHGDSYQILKSSRQKGSGQVQLHYIVP